MHLIGGFYILLTQIVENITQFAYAAIFSDMQKTQGKTQGLKSVYKMITITKLPMHLAYSITYPGYNGECNEVVKLRALELQEVIKDLRGMGFLVVIK